MNSYILLHNSKHGTVAYPFQTLEKITTLTKAVKQRLVEVFKIEYDTAQIDESLELQKVTRLPTIMFYKNETS